MGNAPIKGSTDRQACQAEVTSETPRTPGGPALHGHCGTDDVPTAGLDAVLPALPAGTIISQTDCRPSPTRWPPHRSLPEQGLDVLEGR
jgi:hypothetical protein